jgi:hypothetical protein
MIWRIDKTNMRDRSALSLVLRNSKTSSFSQHWVHFLPIFFHYFLYLFSSQILFHKLKDQTLLLFKFFVFFNQLYGLKSLKYFESKKQWFKANVNGFHSVLCFLVIFTCC